MKQDRAGRTCIQIWSRLPIQHKMACLLGVFLLPMLALTAVLSVEFYSYREQADAIMSDYASCVSYATAFQTENELMEQLLYAPPGDALLGRLADAQAVSDRELAGLTAGSAYDGAQALGLRRALSQSMSHYRAGQAAFLTALRSGSFDADAYRRLADQRGYIQGYAADLTDVLLRAGRTSYLDLGQQLALRNFALIFVLIAAMLGLTVGVTLLVRNIVTPVRRLSEAAGRLERGDYDGPDPVCAQEDEIGQLSRAFAAMRAQISKNIHALEAEAQLEKNLRLHEAEEARLKQLVQESRFAHLQSQINPHFLFNTLQTISTMAGMEQAAVTEDMIVRLAKFFRYTLETDAVLLPLGQELDLVRDYISLQEIRFADRITFEMDCDAACQDVTLPKFTLQPLVENAIVHGLRDRPAGGRIRITTRSRPQGCCITITDNGCGFAAAAARPAQHRGIGLDNIAERLSIRGGALHIRSVPGLGTAARVWIYPAKEEEQHAENSGG